MRALAQDFSELPEGDGDYEEARLLMHDRMSEAMKHSMQALTLESRDRDATAASWWAFRRCVRSAIALHGCARVFEAYG
jgi:hypothetical protein